MIDNSNKEISQDEIIKENEQDILNQNKRIKSEDNSNPRTIKEEDRNQSLSDKIAETGEVSIPKEAEHKNDENNSDENSNKSFKKNFQMGFGFRTGISNSFTTLSANAGTTSQLLNLREESETNLETIDLGLEILLKHKSGIYVSTGIDYLKAARKLEFTGEVVESDTVLGFSAIFVNPITMDSTFQEGLVEETLTRTRTKETYNNLHLINIPLNLGATLNYKQWIFGVQGGASLNVFLNQKGEILERESTFYDLGEDTNNWFKDNLGVSYQGIVLVGYNFNDNFQITGGPSFRSPIIISEDFSPIRQSLVGIGLQLNTRFWFD